MALSESGCLETREEDFERARTTGRLECPCFDFRADGLVLRALLPLAGFRLTRLCVLVFAFFFGLGLADLPLDLRLRDFLARFFIIK